MTDRLDRLEAELSGMRPRLLSDELTDRIEAALEADPSRSAGRLPITPALSPEYRGEGERASGVSPSPWTDRCLLSAMGMGVLSACVIVAILLGSPRVSEPADVSMVASNSTNVKSDVPRLGDSPLALGRGSAAWIDNWK